MKIKVLVSILIGIFLNGCGGGSKGENPPKEESKPNSLINGTWKSICESYEEETSFIAFEWNIRTFSDGNEHILSEIFNTSDCSGTPEYTKEGNRTYKIGNTLTADTGELVYEIDFMFKDGDIELDIVYINPNTLNFGDGTLVPGSRPTDLDFEYIYTKLTEQNENSTQATLYFPLTIGNVWQYYVTVTDAGSSPYTEYMYQNVNKITIVNNAYAYNIKNDIKNLSDENENYLYSKWDDGIYYHEVNDPGAPVSLTYTPPILFLPISFQVNDTWSTVSTLTVNNNGNISSVEVTLNFNVVAIENVTVPAGTFQGCYKITMEFVSPVPDLNENITYWFAENIGMVKIESDGPDQDYVNELQYANINGTIYGVEVVN